MKARNLFTTIRTKGGSLASASTNGSARAGSVSSGFGTPVEPQDQMEEDVTVEELEQRRDLVTRMKAFGERLKERYVNLADLILEGREELEERA